MVAISAFLSARSHNPVPLASRGVHASAFGIDYLYLLSLSRLVIPGLTRNPLWKALFMGSRIKPGMTQFGF